MLMMSRHRRLLSLCDGESLTLGARLQDRAHRVRVSFPPTRRPLDIGEQKPERDEADRTAVNLIAWMVSRRAPGTAPRPRRL